MLLHYLDIEFFVTNLLWDACMNVLLNLVHEFVIDDCAWTGNWFPLHEIVIGCFFMNLSLGAWMMCYWNTLHENDIECFCRKMILNAFAGNCYWMLLYEIDIVYTNLFLVFLRYCCYWMFYMNLLWMLCYWMLYESICF